MNGSNGIVPTVDLATNGAYYGGGFGNAFGGDGIWALVLLALGEVAGEYPDKVLLITMDSHITTSVFGTVMDSFDCRKRIAEDAWIVK